MPDLAFSIEGPDRIHIGRGVVDEAGSAARSIGERAVLVTDSGVRSAGVVEPVASSLREADCAVSVVDSVPSNPSVAAAESVLATVAAHEPAVLVGVGGGSVLDVTKAVAAGLVHEAPLRSLLGRETLAAEPIPTICCPTTAGTGSEVSPAAVLSDEDGVKRAIIDRRAFPTIALVDPRLSDGLPPALTAMTGVDAYSHALGALLSTTANPFSRGVCFEALGLVEAHLRTATDRGRDAPAARDGMAGAATLAMYGRVNGGKAAIHAVAHAVQAVIDVPHGVAIAMVTPAVLEHAIDGGAVEPVAAIGTRVYHATGPPLGRAEAALEGIRSLIEALGLLDSAPRPGTELVAEIADLTLESPRHLEPHPVTIDRAAARAIAEAVVAD